MALEDGQDDDAGDSIHRDRLALTSELQKFWKTFRDVLNDLSVYLQAKHNAVARRLNERPRKTLDYETPAERFQQTIASTD